MALSPMASAIRQHSSDNYIESAKISMLREKYGYSKAKSPILPFQQQFQDQQDHNLEAHIYSQIMQRQNSPSRLIRLPNIVREFKPTIDANSLKLSDEVKEIAKLCKQQSKNPRKRYYKLRYTKSIDIKELKEQQKTLNNEFLDIFDKVAQFEEKLTDVHDAESHRKNIQLIVVDEQAEKQLFLAEKQKRIADNIMHIKQIKENIEQIEDKQITNDADKKDIEQFKNVCDKLNQARKGYGQALQQSANWFELDAVDTQWANLIVWGHYV
ncbi:Hypothetical_protein [Hexamita inflata]|uniref:Hypothetical_protein n=1 Tax=Hexamita inflata TaxID=28002 RepID=A0AA86NHM7_9EUKA|nr:Hypothetical protein HINF_LOCUS7267 [Hexamita inflata]